MFIVRAIILIKNKNMEIKDANGNILQDGDSIIAIKDIKGKGVKIKRGDKFKNISLTDEEGVVESGNLVLKTEFFKKA